MKGLKALLGCMCSKLSFKRWAANTNHTECSCRYNGHIKLYYVDIFIISLDKYNTTIVFLISYNLDLNYSCISIALHAKACTLNTTAKYHLHRVASIAIYLILRLLPIVVYYYYNIKHIAAILGGKSTSKFKFSEKMCVSTVSICDGYYTVYFRHNSAV